MLCSQFSPLNQRYQAIQNQTEAFLDFSPDFLALSRQLFEVRRDRLVPKQFEVWTLLAGLPLPNALTQRFNEVFDEVVAKIPENCQFYKVWPQNYHWEVFIIQRPPEKVLQFDLQQTPHQVKTVLADFSPLTIQYRGFLIAPDGTVMVKGYTNCDEIRDRLGQKLPWASRQQSQLAHISLGRILDPVGTEAFSTLKTLVQESEKDEYGRFTVNEVKYVHESQWYMEEQEIIVTLPIGGDRTNST
ncbi:MAG: hypothetical protein ACLFT0_02085 [Spirulinaceae cyanobacterium]